MKTILITVANGIIARNLLRTDFIEVLKKTAGLKVVLLVPKNKLEFYKKEFEGQNLVFEPFPPEPPLTFSERIVHYFGINGISSSAMRVKQYEVLYNKNIFLYRKLFFFITQRIAWYLGKIKLWRKFLQFLFNSASTQTNYYNLFSRYNPDLVFATYLCSFEEFRLLKQAKRKGIKTLGQILSWDNLTTKIFVFCQPDKFIVPNERAQEELIHYVGYPAKNIFISGSPQYDYYFSKKLDLPAREEFFKKIGADPSKKLILYAISSKKASPNYVEIFQELYQAKERGKIKYPFQIIVRSYPKRDFTEKEKEAIKQYGFLIDMPTTYLDDSKKENTWEIKKGDMENLTNLIYHSDLLLTTYCTIIFDACILNRPIININFDGLKNRPYYISVRKIENWVFYNQKPKSLKTVNNFTELFGAINEYLANPKLNQKEREETAKEQCFFMDGKSGQRMAQFLLQLF